MPAKIVNLPTIEEYEDVPLREWRQQVNKCLNSYHRALSLLAMDVGRDGADEPCCNEEVEVEVEEEVDDKPPVATFDPSRLYENPPEWLIESIKERIKEGWSEYPFPPPYNKYDRHYVRQWFTHPSNPNHHIMFWGAGTPVYPSRTVVAWNLI